METKSELRRRVLHLRDSLLPKERHTFSLAITHRLMALSRWDRARVIFLYVSLGSEVETGSLIQAAMQEGKVVAVPYTDYERKTIIPSILSDLRQDLIPRRFGLLEPAEKKLRPLSASEIDITVAPGCVFDPRGGRIGYGMGFYDRFLPSLRGDSLKLALAFEVQIVPMVPIEKHDYPLDMIITEKRVISPLGQVS